MPPDVTLIAEDIDILDIDIGIDYIMITLVILWSCEGYNSEIECKDGFQKHYSARGQSGRDIIEESEVMTLVKKVAVLYSGCLGFIRTAFSKRMVKRRRCPFHFDVDNSFYPSVP